MHSRVSYPEQSRVSYPEHMHPLPSLIPKTHAHTPESRTQNKTCYPHPELSLETVWWSSTNLLGQQTLILWCRRIRYKWLASECSSQNCQPARKDEKKTVWLHQSNHIIKHRYSNKTCFGLENCSYSVRGYTNVLQDRRASVSTSLQIGWTMYIEC